MDANFRLKRKIVSSDERDPSLGGGWAFFVEEQGYKDYLKARWDQKQDVRRLFLLHHRYLYEALTSEVTVSRTMQ